MVAPTTLPSGSTVTRTVMVAFTKTVCLGMDRRTTDRPGSCPPEAPVPPDLAGASGRPLGSSRVPVPVEPVPVVAPDVPVFDVGREGVSGRGCGTGGWGVGRGRGAAVSGRGSLLGRGVGAAEGRLGCPVFWVVVLDCGLLTLGEGVLLSGLLMGVFGGVTTLSGVLGTFR